jgi:hypothetical protein
MRLRKISIVQRPNDSALVFFNITARADPLGAERGQTLFDVALDCVIAPGATGIVDPDRFVRLELAA